MTVPPFDVASHLRDGVREAGWQTADLWLAALSIGGSLEMSDVDHITAGNRSPTAGEYDLLAVALNERFGDLGQDQPILYWQDLDTPAG